MKYDVKCSKCGGDEILDLWGKGSDREWRIISFNDHGLCDNCRGIERTEQFTILQEKSKKLELPELTGSEKQITWDEKLRLEKVETAKDLIKASKWVKLGFHLLNDKEFHELLLKEYVKDNVSIEECFEAAKKTRDVYLERVKNLENIEAETEAKWFIEHR